MELYFYISVLSFFLKGAFTNSYKLILRSRYNDMSPTFILFIVFIFYLFSWKSARSFSTDLTHKAIFSRLLDT